MRLLGACAIVLVAVLVALAPLAFASPPDPTWIIGFYDNADFDDVVALITGSTAPPAARPSVDVAPDPLVVSVVPAPEARPAPAPLIESHASRAPPSA